MNIDTAKNLEAAATLGKNDRAGFEIEYDAWLAKDEIDGAPDYTVHRKDLTTTLEAVLGHQDTQKTLSRRARVEEQDRWELADKITAEIRQVRNAYTKAFGTLPK